MRIASNYRRFIGCGFVRWRARRRSPDLAGDGPKVPTDHVLGDLRSRFVRGRETLAQLASLAAASCRRWRARRPALHHQVGQATAGWTPTVGDLYEAKLTSTYSAASRTERAASPFHLLSGARFKLLRVRHFTFDELSHSIR